jgi:hypothetical protein
MKYREENPNKRAMRIGEMTRCAWLFLSLRRVQQSVDRSFLLQNWGSDHIPSA